MKIGIIGTGKMGSGLGKLWADAEHTVFFGSRDPQKAQELAATIGPNVKGGSGEEAAAFGEIALLAVPWSAAEATARSLADALKGKILIDCTNAFGQDGLLLPNTTSAGEEIAKCVPDAVVVKAFNGIHYRNLGRSQFGDLRPDVYYCGGDASAKAAVARLIDDAGFEPIDAGPLKMARYVEAMTYLWIRLAFEQGMGGETAFKLLQH